MAKGVIERDAGWCIDAMWDRKGMFWRVQGPIREQREAALGDFNMLRTFEASSAEVVTLREVADAADDARPWWQEYVDDRPEVARLKRALAGWKEACRGRGDVSGAGGADSHEHALRADACSRAIASPIDLSTLVSRVAAMAAELNDVGFEDPPPVTFKRRVSVAPEIRWLAEAGGHSSTGASPDLALAGLAAAFERALAKRIERAQTAIDKARAAMDGKRA